MTSDIRRRIARLEARLQARVSPPLETDNIHVLTATVTIKTLTLSGKQMTLAVFRQIPEKSLFHPDTWEPQGIPWGYVNYCPKSPCQYQTDSGRWHLCGRHLHVIWECDEKLYQCRIMRNIQFDDWCFLDEEDVKNREIWSRWYQLFDDLAIIDQLFIAV
jgi:hypothetical protein